MPREVPAQGQTILGRLLLMSCSCILTMPMLPYQRRQA